MKKKCKSMLAFAMLMFLLCSCGDPEPGVYTDKKTFAFNSFLLEMNEGGQFAINDMLIRINGNILVLGGNYYLYDSKLVLISYHKDIEITFVFDGVNWVYDQKQSKGIENLKFEMDDQAIWEPY